ncbi:hypothetical protein INT43_008112 [Umbelopsis isabellina]|uniref:Uncharacterized protein n=1 Tax=Mortierella isabellina TaxID=91625 RepID=A0A8H7PD50_MORIS|nr:hypothetical protein INT43_008112 [Umbelopsis isabellina]
MLRSQEPSIDNPEPGYQWGFLFENSVFTPFDNHNNEYIEHEWQTKGAHHGHKIKIIDSHLNSPALLYFSVAQIHLRMPGTRYYVIRLKSSKQSLKQAQMLQNDQQQAHQQQQFHWQQQQTLNSGQQPQLLNIEQHVFTFQKHYMNLMAWSATADFKINENNRSLASLAFFLWHQDTFNQERKGHVNVDNGYQHYSQTE